MTNYLNNVLQISEKYRKQIKKLSSPVVESLGIDYVAYQRVTVDGQYSLAINKIDFGEFYIDNKIYEFDPFIRSPKFSSNGIILLDDMVDPKYLNYIEKVSKTFDLNVALALVKTTPFDATFLCLASKKRVPNQLSYYLNELPLLQRYYDYFQEEGKGLIQTMNDNPINMLDFLGQDFHRLPAQMRVEMGTQKRQQFLQLMNKTSSQLLNLTLREKQCLNQLLQGNTAKEAAQNLCLSPRTIEQFLAKLKVKLDCARKSDLFKKALDLKKSGVL